MKGYYIGVKNDLLESKHRKKIGSSVWEFMWLIDKTTSVSEEGIGTVLGGRPIKLDEIATELGVARSTISENLTKLEKEGYINTSNAPYGIIITVNKSSKVFGKTKKYQDSENRTEDSENRTEDSENTKRTIYNTSNNTTDKIVSLPEWLNLDSWEEWKQYKKERKQKLTPSTIRHQLKTLEADKEHQAEIIAYSISNGYTGLFPLKVKPNSKKIYAG